jgi:hypothetical protein
MKHHPTFRRLKESTTAAAHQSATRPKRHKGGTTSVGSSDEPALPAKPRKRQRTVLVLEGTASKHRADRSGRSRGGRSPKGRPGFDAGGATPWSGAGWIPSVPISKGNGPPPPPAAHPQQSPAFGPGAAQGLASIVKGIKNAGSTYGGHTYEDADTADAARAGVQSGLQFDPETGDVWQRGGAVKPRRSGKKERR